MTLCEACRPISTRCLWPNNCDLAAVPVESGADRDRETREAEAREEIARALRDKSWMVVSSGDERRMVQRDGHELADVILALPALRAVREHDALRRDLAALAGLLRSHYLVSADAIADRLDTLLDGGEGGR